MDARIILGDISVDVVRKDIKHVHLSVYPPSGRVRMSAPLRMRTEALRVFAIAKIGWIRQQQQKLATQERETPRDYVDRESHFLFGHRYLLKVVEADEAPSVRTRGKQLALSVRPKTGALRRQAILDEWYRGMVRGAAVPLVSEWSRRMGVSVGRVFVQQMRTRWGSCNHRSGNIRLNTELAKKPIECLEYIVVHELVHLLEPTHNARFVELMDKWMPRWRHRRDALNRLPVRHERWGH